jgi:hypothetical protein
VLDDLPQHLGASQDAFAAALLGVPPAGQPTAGLLPYAAAAQPTDASPYALEPAALSMAAASAAAPWYCSAAPGPASNAVGDAARVAGGDPWLGALAAPAMTSAVSTAAASLSSPDLLSVVVSHIKLHDISPYELPRRCRRRIC